MTPTSSYEMMRKAMEERAKALRSEVESKFAYGRTDEMGQSVAQAEDFLKSQPSSVLRGQARGLPDAPSAIGKPKSSLDEANPYAILDSARVEEEFTRRFKENEPKWKEEITKDLVSFARRDTLEQLFDAGIAGINRVERDDGSFDFDVTDPKVKEFADLRSDAWARGDQKSLSALKWGKYKDDAFTKSEAMRYGLLYNFVTGSEQMAGSVAAGVYGAFAPSPRMFAGEGIDDYRPLRGDKLQFPPPHLRGKTPQEQEEILARMERDREDRVESARQFGYGFTESIIDELFGNPLIGSVSKGVRGPDAGAPRDERLTKGRAGGGVLVKGSEMVGSALASMPWSAPALGASFITKNPTPALLLTTPFFFSGRDSAIQDRMSIWKDQVDTARMLGLPEPAKPSMLELSRLGDFMGLAEQGSEYVFNPAQAAMMKGAGWVRKGIKVPNVLPQSIKETIEETSKSMVRRRGPIGVAKGAAATAWTGAKVAGVEAVEEAIPVMAQEVADPIWIPEGYQSDFWSESTAEAMGIGAVSAAMTFGGFAASNSAVKSQRNREFKKAVGRLQETGVVGAMTSAMTAKAERLNAASVIDNASYSRSEAMALHHLDEAMVGRRAAVLIPQADAERAYTPSVRQAFEQNGLVPIGVVGLSRDNVNATATVYAHPSRKAEVQEAMRNGDVKSLFGRNGLMEPNLPASGAFVVRNKAGQIVDIVPYTDRAQAEAEYPSLFHDSVTASHDIKPVDSASLSAIEREMQEQIEAQAVASGAVKAGPRQMNELQRKRGINTLKKDIAASAIGTKGSRDGKVSSPDAPFQSSMLSAAEAGGATNADVEVEVHVKEVSESALGESERMLAPIAGFKPTVLDAKVVYRIKGKDGKVRVVEKATENDGAYISQTSPDGVFLIRDQSGNAFTRRNAFVLLMHELRHMGVAKSRAAAELMGHLLYLDLPFALRGGAQYMMAANPENLIDGNGNMLTEEEVIANYAAQYDAALAVLGDTKGLSDAKRTMADPKSTAEQRAAAQNRLRSQQQALAARSAFETLAEESVAQTQTEGLGQVAQSAAEWQTIFRNRREMSLRAFKGWISYHLGKRGFSGPQARQAIFEIDQRMSGKIEDEMTIFEQQRRETSRKYQEDLRRYYEAQEQKASQAQDEAAPQELGAAEPAAQAERGMAGGASFSRRAPVGGALTPSTIVAQPPEEERAKAMQDAAATLEDAVGALRSSSEPTPSQVAERDAEYMRAVDENDEPTMQRLVDEAASDAGLTQRVWRGDRNAEGITQYDRMSRREVGIFTTDDRSIADKYAGETGKARRFAVGGRTLDLTKPTQQAVEWIRKWAEDGGWDFIDRQTGEQIAPEDAVTSGMLFDWEGDWSGRRWKDIQATASEQGYDVVKLMDMDAVPFVSTVVLNEQRIKSADSVTRDDAGNVIPLSQRFNTESRDIRYSTRKPLSLYLSLGRELFAVESDTLSPQAWKQRIAALVNKGKIKQDEVNWSGIIDILDMSDAKKISKADLNAMLSVHGLRLEVTQLGGPRTPDEGEKENLRVAAQTMYGQYTVPSPMPLGQRKYRETLVSATIPTGKLAFVVEDPTVDQSGDEIEVRTSTVEAFSTSGSIPKGFIKYRTPATDSQERYYRSIYDTGVLRWVAHVGSAERSFEVDPNIDFAAAKSQARDAAILWVKSIIQGFASGNKEVFRSSHWTKWNIVGHIRSDVASGVLRIMELQSDWGQAIRDKGVRSPYEVRQSKYERFRATADAEFAAWKAWQAVVKKDREASRLLDEADGSNERRQGDGAFRTTAHEKFQVAAAANASTMSESDWNAWKAVANADTDAIFPAYYDLFKEAFIAMSKEAQDSALQYASAAREEKEAMDSYFDERDRVAAGPFVETTPKWLSLLLKQAVLEAIEGGYDKVAIVNGDQVNALYPSVKTLVNRIGYKRSNGRYVVSLTSSEGEDISTPKADYSPSELRDLVGKELGDRIVQSEEPSGELTGDRLEVSNVGMLKFYNDVVPKEVAKLLKKLGGTQPRVETIDGAENVVFDITPEMRESAIASGGLASFSRRMSVSTPSATNLSVKDEPLTPDPLGGGPVVSAQFSMRRGIAGAAEPAARGTRRVAPQVMGSLRKSPRLYSALLREVVAVDAEELSPQAWQQRITSLINKGKVKQDEVEWSGLKQMLEIAVDNQVAKIKKDGIAQFINDNGVRLEQVKRGRFNSDSAEGRALVSLLDDAVNLFRRKNIRVPFTLGYKKGLPTFSGVVGRAMMEDVIPTNDYDFQIERWADAFPRSRYDAEYGGYLASVVSVDQYGEEQEDAVGGVVSRSVFATEDEALFAAEMQIESERDKAYENKQKFMESISSEIGADQLLLGKRLLESKIATHEPYAASGFIDVLRASNDEDAAMIANRIEQMAWLFNQGYSEADPDNNLPIYNEYAIRGTNYREVVITIPRMRGQSYRVQQHPAQAVVDDATFRSHNWDEEKNVLGHYRTVDVRRIAKDEVAMLVMELQSDWAQGRRSYKKKKELLAEQERNKDKYDAMRVRLNELLEERSVQRRVAQQLLEGLVSEVTQNEYMNLMDEDAFVGPARMAIAPAEKEIEVSLRSGIDLATQLPRQVREFAWALDVSETNLREAASRNSLEGTIESPAAKVQRALNGTDRNGVALRDKYREFATLIDAKARMDALNAERRAIDNALPKREDTEISGEESAANRLDAPFIGTTDAWVNLILKQAVLDAIDMGRRTIVFPTGFQVNEILANNYLRKSERWNELNADDKKKVERAIAGNLKFYDELFPIMLEKFNKKLGIGTITKEKLQTSAFQYTSVPIMETTNLHLEMSPEFVAKASQSGLSMFSRRQPTQAATGMNTIAQIAASDIDPISNQPTYPAMFSMRRGIAGAADAAAMQFLDRYDELLRMQRNVERRTGNRLAEVANPYSRARRLQGLLGAQQQEAERRYADILYRQQRAGISIEDMDQFLYAQHAEERNNYIASIDPTRPDGGSGMTTGDANNYLNLQRRRGRYAEMNQFAEEWRGMLRVALDQRLAEGLIRREVYDAVTNQYQRYVPLRGIAARDPWDADFEEVGPNFGRGLSTTGRGIPRATGRRSAAVGVTSQVGYVHEDTFRRIERNRIGNRFLNLVTAMQDRAWAEVVRPTRRVVVNGQVRVVHDQNWTDDGRHFGLYLTVPQRIGGHEYEQGDLVVIRINNARLAQAMLEPSMTLRTWERAMRHANNVWRLMTTGPLNPVFAPLNMIRDVQTAAANNWLTNGFMDTAAMLRRWPSAFRRIMRDEWLGNRVPTGTYADFVRDGGQQMYWRDNDLEVKRADFEALARRAARRDPNDRTLARTLFGWYTSFFTAAETASRLAYYEQRVASGENPQQAALGARDITVDFEKGGLAKPALNTWYIFTNAALQGNANMLRNLVNNPVRAAVTVSNLVLLGYVSAAIARAFGGEDEERGQDRFDNIPDYDKTANIFFFNPDGLGKYVKAPLAYGFNVFFSAGVRLEAAVNGRSKPSDVLGGIMVDSLNAFNPIGGSGIKSGTAGVLTSLTPTMVRPLAEITANTDFAGRPIYREQIGRLQAPDSETAFESTPEAWRNMAKFINQRTGGDAFEAGAIDISPDTMRYLTGYYLSGMGRNLDRLYTAMTDPDTDVSDIPLVRSFVGDAANDKRSVGQQYYDIVNATAATSMRLRELESPTIEERYNTALQGLEREKVDLTRAVEQTELDLRKLRQVAKTATPAQQEAIREARRKLQARVIKERNRLDSASRQE